LGAVDALLVDLIMLWLFSGPSRTVLAADGSKVEDVELAALSHSATAEGRVGLGEGDRSACGESEDGGGELHDDDCGSRGFGLEMWL